jgi:hypothetical protein
MVRLRIKLDRRLVKTSLFSNLDSMIGWIEWRFGKLDTGARCRLQQASDLHHFGFVFSWETV